MKFITIILSYFLINPAYASVACDEAVGINANISAALIFNLQPQIEIEDISAQHAIRSSQALKSAALETCVSEMAGKYKDMPLKDRLEKINMESNEVLADFMAKLVAAIPSPTAKQESLIVLVSKSSKDESAEITFPNMPDEEDFKNFSDNW